MEDDYHDFQQRQTCCHTNWNPAQGTTGWTNTCTQRWSFFPSHSTPVVEKTTEDIPQRCGNYSSNSVSPASSSESTSTAEEAVGAQGGSKESNAAHSTNWIDGAELYERKNATITIIIITECHSAVLSTAYIPTGKCSLCTFSFCCAKVFFRRLFSLNWQL